jgi:hypothetical protein
MHFGAAELIGTAIAVPFVRWMYPNVDDPAADEEPG